MGHSVYCLTRTGMYSLDVGQSKPEWEETDVDSRLWTTKFKGGFASINGAIYVAGGFGGTWNSFLNTVHRYSPVSSLWEPLMSMIRPRANFQLVALGGKLYAIGGENDGVGDVDTSSAVEQYNPDTNLWSEVASMHYPRVGHAAAAMGGFLYVAGGRNSLHSPTLASCERYDPNTDTWSLIAPLPEPRVWLALASLRSPEGPQALYAIGGTHHDHNDARSPPWRYNQKSNTWQEAPLKPGSPAVRFYSDSVWVAVDSGRVSKANLESTVLHRGMKGLPADMILSLGPFLGAQGRKVFERETRSLKDAALVARDTHQVRQLLQLTEPDAAHVEDILAEIRAAGEAAAASAREATLASFAGVIQILEAYRAAAAGAAAGASALKRVKLAGGAYFGFNYIK